MRIVFIDIHEINFLVRPYRQIKDGNQIATYKHKFVLDYAIKNGIELCSYLSMNKLNEEGSKALKWIVSRKILKKFNYVLRNSYAEPINIKPIINKNEIKDSDILIGYLYNNQLEIMRELKGIKVLMGNHFVAINQPINLDDYGIKAFVNEIDLSDNEFVNRYIYGKGIKHITVPYIYAERFNNQNKVRKNKAMAIGTLSTCSGNSGYRLYREFTGTEWIQPLRKMILDNKDDLIEEVDSYISYIFEDKIVINKEDNILVKYYKKIKNYTTGWTQKKYMSFNMVDKNNEYKMFFCPEE